MTESIEIEFEVEGEGENFSAVTSCKYIKIDSDWFLDKAPL